MSFKLTFCVLLVALPCYFAAPTRAEIKAFKHANKAREPSIGTSFKSWNEGITAHRSPHKNKLAKPSKGAIKNDDDVMDAASLERFARLEELRQDAEEKQTLHRFNPGPWSSITVDDSKVLGQGGFGRVCLGHTQHGTSVAVKMIDYVRLAKGDQNMQTSVLESIKNEAQICGTVEHVNLMQCAPDYHRSKRKGLVSIVFEYCDAGDFLALIQSRQMTKEAAQCSFFQIMQGVHYLHRNDIVHADIKPDNIFVQSNGILKIGDFGLSKRVSFGKKISGLRGTTELQSPEMPIAYKKYKEYLQSRKADPGLFPTTDMVYDPFAADIWAAGVTYVMSRMAARPWKRAELHDINYHVFTVSPSQYLENLEAATHVPPKDHFSPQELDFVLSMLEIDPQKRITASQVMQHEWYQSLLSTCPPSIQSLYP